MLVLTVIGPMCITSVIYVRTASRIESHVLIPRAAPYIPPIDPSNASDTQNFDDTFLDMEPVINDENDMDTDQEREREQTDLEPTDGEDSVATPSQSRSSSAHPPDDSVDVFDGYSFKGRNSVIIDDEEEVSEEEEEAEEENVTGPSVLAELNGEEAAATVVLGREEPIPEPKTPEARPTSLPPLPSTPPAKRSPVSIRPELPPVDTTARPASFIDATPRASEDSPAPAPTVPISPIKAVAHAAAVASQGPDVHHKESKKASASKSHGQRSSRQRNRREKSGVPALDRDLSDVNDEDDVRTERDEDDWDFIEAAGEERNGARGASLFARGVVDRYRLAVFRKGSTPSRPTPPTNDTARLSALTNGSGSPSPTAKERRGRTPALPSFGRRAFLRPKSPPSASSRSSRSVGKSFTTMSERSVSATVSTVSSPQSARTTLAQPSLKSRESAVSVGSPGSSSGASTNGEGRPPSDVDVVETVRAPRTEEHEKHKSKKLKKGTKVFSLFGKP